jgi:hypothetical protein
MLLKNPLSFRAEGEESPALFRDVLSFEALESLKG